MCFGPVFLGGKETKKWGLEIATRDGSREMGDAKWAVEMRAACIYVLACAGFSLVARFAFVFFSSQDGAREGQKFSDDPKKGGDEAAFFHFFFFDKLRKRVY